MNYHSNKDLSNPQLSRIRTVLFWGLALVWFNEMLFMGFPFLSKIWTHLWKVIPPQDGRFESALNISWAIAAPEKGALFVMAVFGIISKSPSTRTALFIPMSLVPALNIAFPFRQQGFLFGPVMVATVLSIILWGGFFFSKEPSIQTKQNEKRDLIRLPLTRWEMLLYAWFGLYASALTLMAFLFLFVTTSAVNLVFPCLSDLLSEGGHASLIHTNMANGTHLLAVAGACWLATIHYRTNPTLRNALTIACTLHAALFIAFPLRQLITEFGLSCASSSMLVIFVPLLIGWLIYLSFSYRVKPINQKLSNA
jgi:hypothetical protein